MSPPPQLNISDPAVRRYLRLVRLQVLTPLALLINLATCLVCSFLVHPSLSGVSREHLTSLSPSPIVVGVYWLLVFAGQIGFCLLLVIARKEETKARRNTLVSLGLSVVLANWVMAAWAVAWTLQTFVASTVMQGLLVLLLLYANLNLLLRSANHPTSSRPLDALFIHAPIRLFLIMPLTLMLWESLFITMKHSWTITIPEDERDRYHWEGVAVVASTSVVGLLVVAARGDIVWTVGAMLTLAAVAFGPYHNVPVLATSIVFMVLFPITLVAALVFSHVRESKQEGAIALPPDAEEQPTHTSYHHEDEHDPEVERLRIRMEDEQQHTDPAPAPPPPRHAGNGHQNDSVEESVWG
ncbi:hypothetical protein EXIGLDRAFT_609774 [Exidia glandulosa HHB12029]|uniref:Uncharacterized protein n=1 Tax=Exidia glandulosa HHB12029 TaxID=1314781 RepID=A0A165K9W5_EXIGL|nr:hypothetical protein EXIGLDRAFT_609774 [Exidia glandulosa HHB12029]